MKILVGKYTYCPETGEIRRAVRAGNYSAGSLCGAVNQRGYRTIHHLGKVHLQHRLAWFLHYGEEPPQQIDHVDGDPLNNRITNLRAACNSTNQCNIQVHTRSQTQLKGIFPLDMSKRKGVNQLYRAEVCKDGVRYQKHSTDLRYLEEWVRNKREELHGEYAKH